MATQALPSFLSASTFTVTEGGVVQTDVSTVLITSVLPTQALPPYLSASTFTETVGGVETVGVTTVNLPLTYFGPSIPLGTDWTFGGSTSPASLTQTTSQTATATPSSSQITSVSSPSTGSSNSAASSSTSSSAATGSSSGSAVSGSGASSTPTSSFATSSSSPTNASTSSAAPSASLSSPTVGGASNSNHISGGKLAGIIIAAIVVAIVIIMLLILFCVRYRRRRTAYAHSNVSDFVIVDSEGSPRYAGEGVPRATGEEEDPFLERDSEATAAMSEVDPTARLVTSTPRRSASVRTTGTQIPPGGVVPTALKTPPSSPTAQGGPKTPSPFFHASASSLFFNPARGPDQSLTGAAAGALKRDSASTRGSATSQGPLTVGNKIIAPRELMQMDDQWRQEMVQDVAEGSGAHRNTSEIGERLDVVRSSLSPPAAAANADTGPSNLSRQSYRSHLDSPGSEEDESVMLLTAQRVNMGDGRRILVHDNDETSPTSWQSNLGIGLGGLTRLSRLSWFQRLEQNRTRPHSTPAARRSSRSPLPPPDSAGARSSLLGVPRPVSDMTASSTGDTTFYDAPSNPSTLSSRSENGNGNDERPASMPRPPSRAVTHAGGSANNGRGTPAAESDRSALDQPALLMLYPPAAQLASEPPANSSPQPTTPQVPRGRAHADILDTPVPARAAVSPFGTSSTRSGPSIPPGLEHLANVRVWRDSAASDTMPSSGTFGTGSDNGVSIDVVGGSDTLEDEPPRPREGWTLLRSASATMTSNATSRTPLWRPEEVDLGDDVHSVMASLHSIPENLRPISPAGSGSNSRGTGSGHTPYNSSSLGSGSDESRFSRVRAPHIAQETSSSSGALTHSNSVTSEGRRRPRRAAGEPLLTPANSGDFGIRARLSAIGGYRSPPMTPQRSPQPGTTFGRRPDTAGSLVGRTT